MTVYRPYLPRGSRYLIIKELRLKDHNYYGFWDLSPEHELSLALQGPTIWELGPLKVLQGLLFGYFEG